MVAETKREGMRRLCLLLFIPVLSLGGAGASGGFLGSLTPEQRARLGLATLTAAQAAELLRVQVQTERPVVAAAQIKMVAKQVLLQSPVAAELTLPVVLVQQEMPVVQQMDPFLPMAPTSFHL